MSKKKPKLGDWVCSVCGGTDLRCQCSYEAYFYATVEFDEYNAGGQGDFIQDCDDVACSQINFRFCNDCHPDGRGGYDSELTAIQLKLEGPFPSQWSAHDIAEWVRKQKRRKA